MKRIVCSVVLAMAMIVPTVQAEPIVTIILNVNNSTGMFELLAKASQSDNRGIASYGIPLAGDITSVQHVSPSSLSLIGQDVGFRLLRTGDDNRVIAASQNTVSNPPTPHIVFGIGQQPGNLAEVAVATGGAGLIDVLTVQPEFDSPVLIATGTFDNQGEAPRVDLDNVDLFANVFIATATEGDPRTEAAKVIVPEPLSAGMLLLGLGVAALKRSRKVSVAS